MSPNHNWYKYKDIRKKDIEVNAMSKEKIKVYLYTRVSTSIQIDGYSLEAQKSRMRLCSL